MERIHDGGGGKFQLSRKDCAVLTFFSRLGPYLKQYVPRFIRATVASLVYAGAVGALALLVKPIMSDPPFLRVAFR